MRTVRELDISATIVREYGQEVALKDLKRKKEWEPVFSPRTLKPQAPNILETTLYVRDGYPPYLALIPSKSPYRLISIGGTSGTSEAIHLFRPILKPLRYIQPDIAQEVKPFLSAKAQQLLNSLINLSLIQAQQNSLPVQRLQVVLRRYPSEDVEEIVLKIFIQANSKQAIAFWEALEARIEEWKAKLPSQLAESLDLLSISVIWSV